MKKPSIVVLGSSNTDMIVKSARIPKPGETILGGIFSTAAGGKGANQAVSAARAGGRVAFIARVGDDSLGREALAGFRKDGIITDFITVDKNAPSGVALIIVGECGENSIAVAPGANARLSEKDVAAACDVIISARILLMQLEVPLETVRAAAETASSNGVPVVLNPAPAQPLDDDLLSRVSLITPNETEAEILTGITVHGERDAEKAADVLFKRGVRGIIITLGAKGVYCDAFGTKGFIPGFTVDAVDTTAAGDVFNGVLAAMIAEHMPFFDAVSYAQAAAALSVTKLGAQPSAPYMEDIEEFIRERND